MLHFDSMPISSPDFFSGKSNRSKKCTSQLSENTFTQPGNKAEYPALGYIPLNFPLLKNQTPVLGAKKRQLRQHFWRAIMLRDMWRRRGLAWSPKRLHRD